MKFRHSFYAIVVLLFGLPHAGMAQQVGKLYYLLDTAKTSVNDRLWEITYDAPVKYYQLHCLCFPPNDDLVLDYSEKNEARTASKADLRTLHLIKLTELIKLSKETIENTSHRFDFFLIEPFGSNYKIHQVRLNKTQRQQQLTDYEIIHPADSLKKQKP